MLARPQKHDVKSIRGQRSGFRIQDSGFGVPEKHFRFPLSVFRFHNSAIRNRTAATLSEVLMSLMIMSIGLVSLATMFPIATLKAIQATQLTQATNIRYNAEAMLRSQGIIEDSIAFNGGSGRPVIFDPYGYYFQSRDYASVTGDTIDDTDATNAATKHGSVFGHIPTADAGSFTGLTLPLRSWGGSISYDSLDTAVALTRPADSWMLIYDGAPKTAPSAGDNTVVLPDETELQALDPTSFLTRVTIIGTDGRTVVTRRATSSTNAATNRSVSWDTQEQLPTGFVGERVVVEIQDRHYSWLATVRTTNLGTASVDIAVFFNRSPFIDVQADGTIIDSSDRVHQAVFTKGQTSVSVTYTNTNDKPFFKKGGFIFDAPNAYWYRIQDVANENANPLVFTITEPAYADSTAAILMPGVVDVFPVGIK